MFRPEEIKRLRTPAELLTPIYSEYNGVSKKTYPDHGALIYINFKSRGGTDTVVNGIYSVISTAEIVTWYRDDIRSDCRIKINSDLYEIKGEPEDVELQHQVMILKVEKVSGGV